jgi:hypothetical protein
VGIWLNGRTKPKPPAPLDYSRAKLAWLSAGLESPPRREHIEKPDWGAALSQLARAVQSAMSMLAVSRPANWNGRSGFGCLKHPGVFHASTAGGQTSDRRADPSGESSLRVRPVGIRTDRPPLLSCFRICDRAMRDMAKRVRRKGSRLIMTYIPLLV